MMEAAFGQTNNIQVKREEKSEERGARPWLDL